MQLQMVKKLENSSQKQAICCDSQISRALNKIML